MRKTDVRGGGGPVGVGRRGVGAVHVHVMHLGPGAAGKCEEQAESECQGDGFGTRAWPRSNRISRPSRGKSRSWAPLCTVQIVHNSVVFVALPSRLRGRPIGPPRDKARFGRQSGKLFSDDRHFMGLSLDYRTARICVKLFNCLVQEPSRLTEMSLHLSNARSEGTKGTGKVGLFLERHEFHQFSRILKDFPCPRANS